MKKINFSIIFEKIKSKKRFFNIVLVLIIWIATVVLFAKHSIGNPNFWFDESGQFWIAKGLNHYSQPFAPEGGLTQVLKNNAKFNLDPGGFSIILHFWTILSTNHNFLRSLPFLFFVIAMIVVFKLSTLWKSQNHLVYFGGFILLSSSLLKQYAFELRPYSMEMLTTIIALYFCYKIPDILNSRKYALFSGSLLALLLTSRYSAFFSILSLGILIFVMLILKFFKKKNVINFILFTIPIIVSVISICIFSLRYQNPSGTPPEYIREFMFKTSSVSKILFNKESFFTIFPFLLLTLIFLFSLKIKFLRKITKQYRLYFFYALILNLIFILLSTLGRYTWGINSRWDISTHTIFTIAWIPLLLIFTSFFHKKYFVHNVFQFVVLVFFVLYFFNQANIFRYVANDSVYDNFIANNLSQDSKILINASASPTTRYLFEYGLLKNYKNSNTYRNLSIFNHTYYISEKSIKNLDDIEEYDYIILTHIDYTKSEIKKILSQKSNWVDCTTKDPSKIFKNIEKISI